MEQYETIILLTHAVLDTPDFSNALNGASAGELLLAEAALTAKGGEGNKTRLKWISREIKHRTKDGRLKVSTHDQNLIREMPNWSLSAVDKHAATWGLDGNFSLTSKLAKAELARRKAEEISESEALNAEEADATISPLALTSAETPPLTPAALVSISGVDFIPSNAEKIGLVLRNLYRDAEEAELRIIRFGVAFLAAESLFEGAEINCATNGAVSGGRGKRGGFRKFLALHAPEVPETTGRRYLDIAKALIEKFQIEKPEVLFFSTQELPKELETKKEEVREFLSNKTMKAIQLDLGLDFDTPANAKTEPHPKDEKGGAPNSTKGKTPEQLAEEFHWSKADRLCYAEMQCLTLPGATYPERLRAKLEALGEDGRKVFFASLPAAISDCALGLRKPGRMLPGLFGKAAPQKGRADVDHLENIRKCLTGLRGSLPHWNALTTSPDPDTKAYSDECFSLWRKVLDVLPGHYEAIAAEHFAPRKK